MDGREELCNSAPEDETVIRERKRLRRVSFAENTEVHVFDRDEEYSSTPPLPPPSPLSGSQQQYPQLSLLRQESTEDDDDDLEEEEDNEFLRPSPSPGSAVSSTTSNDEENFFGPVSPSFIRLGGQFDSSAASDDHDITLDSTAFSMHYQSLAQSDSSAANCKTPTPSFEGKNSAPSDSRSFMVMTEVKKRIPFESFSGGRDSNEMKLIGNSASDKYDYAKLSPTLESFVAQLGKDRDPASLSEVQMQPFEASQEGGDFSGGRVSKDMSLVRKSPSSSYNHPRQSPALKSFINQSGKDTHHDDLSDQICFPMPFNHLSTEADASRLSSLNNIQSGNSSGGRDSRDTSLITSSSSSKYDHGRLSGDMESLPHKSKNETLINSSLFSQISVLKSPNLVNAESNIEIPLSKAEEPNSIQRWDSTDACNYNITKGSSTLKPLQAESRNYMHHGSPSDQISALKSPIRLNAESKAEIQAFEAIALNNNGRGNFTGAHDPNARILFRNSPSKQYDYNRPPPSVETLKVKSRNYMHYASVSHPMNVSNSLNHLNTDNKVEEPSSSKVKEAINIHTGDSNVCGSGDTRLVKLSPIFESLLSPRHNDVHPSSASDQEKAHGFDKLHDQPPFSPCHLLPPFQKLKQRDQTNISKSSNSPNTDSKVEASHPSVGAEEKNTRHNPTVTRVNLGEDQLDHCPLRNKEVAKTEGYGSKGHGANVLKDIHEAVEKLLSPSIGKLNSREFDILEDMLERMQKALKYEKLSCLVQFQRSHNPLVDDHQRRIAEAQWLQETLIYEHAKLILLRTKQERICKNIQHLKSGLEETQVLKFSANNILQSCAKVIQSKDAILPSLSVDLSIENMDKCNKVTERLKELESLDMKVNNLTKSLLASCKIKEETSFDECLVLINEHLRRKKHCRLLQRNLQLYEVDRLERDNGHCNLVLNYDNVLHQSFRMSCDALPKLVTYNQLNNVNIMKSFPNMNACVAFAFVFNEDTRILVSSKCLAVETQMTRSRFHNLLMVVGEVQQACLDLRNLIQTSFCSSCVGLLELEFCFMDFKTGNKVTLILDVTCLNRGVYPLEIHPQISTTPVSESLSAEIGAATKALKVGYTMIHRLCVCVAQVVNASSR